MKNKKQALERVTVMLTKEQLNLVIEESVQKHAGNLSFLFRKILDEKYNLDTNLHVRRQGVRS